MNQLEPYEIRNRAIRAIMALRGLKNQHGLGLIIGYDKSKLSLLFNYGWAEDAVKDFKKVMKVTSKEWNDMLKKAGKS